MFLLVSDLHVGAHLDGHQHGVSIQGSILYKFGDILFPNISHMKNCTYLNFSEDLYKCTFFHIPVSGTKSIEGF